MSGSLVPGAAPGAAATERSSDALPLVAVVALGVVLRLIAWWSLPSAPVPYFDESAYLGAGRQLVSGGGQDTYWPPLAGWLAAAAMALTSPTSLAAVRLVWVLLDTITLVLVWRLGRSLNATLGETGRSTRWLPVAGAAAYALYVPAVGYATIATSEAPASLLILCGVVVVLATDGRRWLAWGIAGLAFGLTVLTRSNLLPLVVALPWALSRFGRMGAPHRRRRAGALLALVLAVTVIGGWLVRNRVVEGTWSMSGNALANFYRSCDLYVPT